MKTPPTVKAVYSPESSLRQPAVFFRGLVMDLFNGFGLARALAGRDISAMYRQSLLGYIWAFLPPLGTTGVFLFLRAGGAFKTGDPGMAYAVYVLVGTLLWQVFADSVNGPLKAVGTSRSMLVKIRFPRESLILAALMVTTFNFFVRLAVLIPAVCWFAWKGLYEFHLSALVLFPLGVVGIVLLGYAIGVLITPLGMFYTDVTIGMQTLMLFWMLASPVVVTRPASGMVAKAMCLNPVTHVLEFARNGLVGLPCAWQAFGVVAGMSILAIILGMIAFRVALPHTVARMGM